MARARPNVYSIAPGANFARALVRAILGGGLDLPVAGDDPFALADLLIYVPTQRIRRVLELEFERAVAPRATLLPAIHALGEPHEEIVPEPGEDLDPHTSRRLVSASERQFRLYPLVRGWLDRLTRERRDGDMIAFPVEGRSGTVAEAFRLAGALGQLIDELAIEGLPLSALATIAPADFDPSAHDEYWAMTREFLALAASEWPAMLDALGMEDQQARRQRLLGEQAERLRTAAASRPVIVAGSTGSVRATAQLMRVVARLDRGAVVLPGLDMTLGTTSGDTGWDRVGDESASLASRFAHPQASLKRTLAVIGIDRLDVQPLDNGSSANAARNAFISEALRPAETTGLWQSASRESTDGGALAGLSVVCAPNERSEALAIALAMRETLETPLATVALVTPDRAIARRVQVELLRWNITASDSAAARLDEGAPGLLLRLLFEAEKSRSGAALVALLRHPLVRLDGDRSTIEPRVSGLELLVWRGRRFDRALPIERQVIAALTDDRRAEGRAARRISEAVRSAIVETGRQLDALFALLGSALELDLSARAGLVRSALLVLTRDDGGVSIIEQDPDWPALCEVFDEVEAFAAGISTAFDAVGPLFEHLLGQRMRPARADAHPRAMILGLLEARLFHPDRVIVAGFNEGILPPVAEPDPFLNRAMRVAIGLQPPERRIGQVAHDVTMLTAHPDVVISHSERVGTKPGLPSRFLRRFEAFAGSEAWKGVVRRGERYLALAEHLDAPDGPPRPLPRPAIIPRAPRLPARLSITDVETLRRDPYALYARRLLMLDRLEPLDAEPDARDRGSGLHTVLERFSRQALSDHAEEAAIRLRELGVEEFRRFAAHREVHHFWWQAFEAIIPGIVALEFSARRAGRPVLVEVDAETQLELPSGDSIRLVGTIDRIEREADGRVTIFDFKSGAPPSVKQVLAGLAPQLTITGAIVGLGAVNALPAGTMIADLAYVPLSGKVPVEPLLIEPENGTLADVMSRQFTWLTAELSALATGAKPWRSHVAPVKRASNGDYDHLARLREWKLAGEDDDGESEEEGA
jgi:ATP-dependent helicase/nuclease subunit B